MLVLVWSNKFTLLRAVLAVTDINVARPALIMWIQAVTTAGVTAVRANYITETTIYERSYNPNVFTG